MNNSLSDRSTCHQSGPRARCATALPTGQSFKGFYLISPEPCRPVFFIFLWIHNLVDNLPYLEVHAQIVIWTFANGLFYVVVKTTVFSVNTCRPTADAVSEIRKYLCRSSYWTLSCNSDCCRSVFKVSVCSFATSF